MEKITESIPDSVLVKRFIEGDESSFNKLIERYQKKIYWHARRMTGNHLDADEVVQEVLIVLYKKLKDFEFKSSLYTWIYKITTTRSINLINRNKVKKIFSINEADAERIAKQEDIVDGIINKQKIERMNNLLQKLPVKQREVFILRNFDELGYEEISEITGKSVGALKANYFHALKKITEMMSNEED